MELAGVALTEELCAGILRRLEPPGLAALSACSSAARRLAAGDGVWAPLLERLVGEQSRKPRRGAAAGTAAAAGAAAAAAPPPARRRRDGPPSVGVYMEEYRLLHRNALRDAVWKLRQKVAGAEDAHAQAQRQCVALDREAHRCRWAAESERQAMCRRLAHGGGWHPAAVHAQLAGGASAASAVAAHEPKLPRENKGKSGPGTAEDTLRRSERLSASQHQRERRRFESLGQKQAALAVLEAQWARSQQAPLLSYYV